MKILLVTATRAETEPLRIRMEREWKITAPDVFTNGSTRVHMLVSGVGMMATAWALTRMLLQEKFDFVLQAGIAGSFNRNIALGEVVRVEEDGVGDLGSEDHYQFRDVFELGLEEESTYPFRNGRLSGGSCPETLNILLPAVTAISVNTVTGSSFTAEARWRKFRCDLETMEGAAFHFVCLKERVLFAQVRAISNYAEARDRENWKILESVSNLNNWLWTFLNP